MRKKLLVFCSSLLITLSSISSITSANSNDILLSHNSPWKYYDNGELSNPDWKNSNFDDSQWKNGLAPLGYGDEVSETNPNVYLGTEVGFGADPDNKHMTTYFRNNLIVSNLAQYSSIEVYIHVDDGAIVYANGIEVFRKGIDPGSVNYNTSAKFKPKEETFIIPVSILKEGTNIISAEVHQDDGQSSDLWFELSLKGIR